MLLRGLIKMSKKDFDIYYQSVHDQYYEMLDTLNELSELASTGMVAPELVENTQKLVDPLKQNYMTLSYVAFLLNEPRRTHKIDRYIKQNKKLLVECGNRTERDVIRENDEVIEKLKNDILSKK